jgi:hypothetical protein
MMKTASLCHSLFGFPSGFESRLSDFLVRSGPRWSRLVRRRSAGFQPAVSQVFNLQGGRTVAGDPIALNRAIAESRNPKTALTERLETEK